MKQAFKAVADAPTDRAVPAAPDVSLAPPLPRFVQIEPVGQCNLRCRMCPIQYRQDGPPHGPPAFLNEDVFHRLVESFGPIDELQLQGLGEPMMHPRFFDMVSFATRRGIRVSTNTNLTLLTARRAALCVDSGLFALHASLDGATASTYESIRVGANFGKVIRNLDRLMNTIRSVGAVNPRVRIVTVLMRRNLDELTDVVDLAAHHGVREVFVQRLCHDFTEETLPTQYRGMRDFVERERLGDDDVPWMESAFAAARERAQQVDVELRLPRLRSPTGPDNGGLRCDWPWRGAYLSYRGEAMPCCMVSTPDRIQFGNMAKDGVERVWHNDEYRAFRAALASDDPPAICRGCAVYRREF